MASLIPAGSASGTGSMTLAAPVTNSTQTATLPDATGTVMVSGNMPAFSYYQSSAQTLGAAVQTKLTFTASDFDTTSGMYSSSRFTPTIAGYYNINGSVTVGNNSQNIVSVYKNGSNVRTGVNISNGYYSSVQTIVYCNGSTDYIEIYCYMAPGGTTGTGIGATMFQGILARTA